LDIFRASLGEFVQKSFAPPKILPALTHMLNGIYFSHKQKKETHFDYNAEDDTIGQWFSNLYCGILSLHPKPLRSPSFCQSFFDKWQIRFGRFLA